MGQRLIILLAALLLALTLACEMAGGIGNALQDEPADAGDVSTAPAPTTTLQQVSGEREVLVETAASTSVPVPADVPTPDPTVAVAIASLNDISNCRELEKRMRQIESRWPYLPKKSLRDLEWVDAGTIIQDFIQDETKARQDWGNRCVRVRLPDWPDDRGERIIRSFQGGTHQYGVWALYPDVGQATLETGCCGTGNTQNILRGGGGFCSFADWKPASGGELPVLTFDQCWYYIT